MHIKGLSRPRKILPGPVRFYQGPGPYVATPLRVTGSNDCRPISESTLLFFFQLALCSNYVATTIKLVIHLLRHVCKSLYQLFLYNAHHGFWRALSNQSKSIEVHIPENTMDPTLFHKFLVHSLVAIFFITTDCNCVQQLILWRFYLFNFGN